MVHNVTRSEGGCDIIRARGAAKLHSSICLIPLWLSPLNRPSRFGRGRKRGRERPPPKAGGHVTPDSGTVVTYLYPGPMGSLSSSFIPAGRLGTAPRSGAESTETDL